ncbi:MAG: cyclic pyranopterin monophosphate synthase MoaC [Gemmatimonas sp.]|nr:cyclic pyranopterin monophosphate synthase MoaC [Gemmatimonas sp.]
MAPGPPRRRLGRTRAGDGPGRGPDARAGCRPARSRRPGRDGGFGESIPGPRAGPVQRKSAVDRGGSTAQTPAGPTSGDHDWRIDVSSEGFTHLDEHGRPRMVDVGGKRPTHRRAVAEGQIVMSPETARAIASGATKKGNVLLISEVAGIAGAKRTSDLIPLCHPVSLSSVEVRLEVDRELPGVRATASAEVVERTGVEMEALTAVTVALLTVYDMCKALDRGMRIEGVRLLRKEGGRSGTWTATTENE